MALLGVLNPGVPVTFVGDRSQQSRETDRFLERKGKVSFSIFYAIDGASAPSRVTQGNICKEDIIFGRNEPASIEQEARCVLWFHETKSPINVQRAFRRCYGRNPDTKSITRWYEKFKETGSVTDLPRSGRPSVSEATVELVRQSFQRSPTKSTRQALRELQIPQTSLVRILHKRLRLHAHKVQIVQDLQPNDCTRRAEFAIEILNRIDIKNDYLNRICFSDESTFHVSGIVNRHNVPI
ncbi:hypothetical protein AVEN_72729-1 [Araneus ventricosus]|uniref:DUF4817 domain-containing protein n=1 Tax=Araneus ventricosus TaxID=182803 RepID=A0A4Y2DS01_ARAVE|nr:hypothetical protein AVEN_72729-1 [Araneus ventricosus]